MLGLHFFLYSIKRSANMLVLSFGKYRKYQGMIQTNNQWGQRNNTDRHDI